MARRGLPLTAALLVFMLSGWVHALEPPHAVPRGSAYRESTFSVFRAYFQKKKDGFELLDLHFFVGPKAPQHVACDYRWFSYQVTPPDKSTEADARLKSFQQCARTRTGHEEVYGSLSAEPHKAWNHGNEMDEVIAKFRRVRDPKLGKALSRWLLKGLPPAEIREIRYRSTIDPLPAEGPLYGAFWQGSFPKAKAKFLRVEYEQFGDGEATMQDFMLAVIP